MSFPGYLKSLKLKAGNGSHIPHTPPDQELGPSSRTSRDEFIPPSSFDDYDCEDAAHSEILDKDSILDEKDNGPSKSLWVGNIPLRTTSSELRVLFSRFGNIVSTKPAAKYAFVNFETIDSAIAAFKTYHDQDIFKTGNSTINIRFTQTLAEAKQAKDDSHRRKSSMSVKADAAQKMYFQSVSSTKEAPSSGAEWPNGKPPTGPKSQRCDISPPPLRRGDSYRPDLSRGDSYRSDDQRRDGRDEHRSSRGYHRTSHYSPRSYSPTYSPTNSRSPSRSVSSAGSPRRNRSRGEESPLPWERKKGSTQFRNLVWAKEVDTKSGGGIAPATLAAQTSEEQNVPQVFGETMNDMSDGKHSNALSPKLAAASVTDHTHDSRVADSNEAARNINMYLASKESTTCVPMLSPFISLRQASKSPSVRPLERLRMENESIRSSPVPSEVATSSSRTSLKKRRCHDCGKGANDLSPLVKCSKCRIRLHSGCGNPKPSSSSNRANFICGGCQSKREAEENHTSTAAKTKTLTKLGGKVHLVSPPLSSNCDGNGSTNMSPRDELSHLFADERRLEAFFSSTKDDVEAAINPVVKQNLHEPTTSVNERPSMQNSISYQQPVPLTPVSMTAKSVPMEEALKKKNKYKAVTCKFWTSGNCTQTEDCCYYSHAYTDISIPDRRRPNKRWTCYDWLQRRCTMPERDCLFAHQDTGLHVWRDGRPSFKHVTCFWWLKGKCKWDNESCKFGHQDTGLYSLDPSEISQGGSKFTIVPPVDTTHQYQHSANTSASILPTTSNIGHESAQTEHRVLDQPLSNMNNREVLSSSMKPSLTIDTSKPTSLLANHSSSSDIHRFFGRIGAPPETPKEDSPDKLRPQELYPTNGNFGYKSRVSDLPTPGIDVPIAGEQEPRDYIQARSALQTGGNSPRDGNRMDLNDVSLTEIPESTANSQDSLSGFPTAVTSNLETLEVTDVSRDPRLQRSSLASNAGATKIQGVGSSPATRPAVATSSNDHTPAVDETTRRGIKRCQRCQKPIFASTLCRTCSSDNAGDSGSDGKKENQDVNESPNNVSTKTLLEAEKGQERDSDTVTTIKDTVRKDSDSTPVQAEPQPSLKNPLKRNSSGSNIFLKNKRPRNPILFKPNGLTRPDVLKQNQPVKRPQIVSSNLDSRREPRPTLDELISEERAKNVQKRNSLILDTEVVESPISNDEKENRTPDSPGEVSPVQSRASTLSTEAQGRHMQIVVQESHPSTNGDTVSSPRQSPTATHSVLADSIVEVQDRHSPILEVVRSKRSPSRPTREISQWRSSESPQPEPIRPDSIMADSTKQTEMAPILPTLDMTAPKSPTKMKRPAPLQRLSSREIMISPERFSWASSITCTICQKNHKKCLHGNDGALSAVKCREYVLSRNGKPDSGRSRHEWVAILEASELDPDTEDDQTSEQSESPAELFSGESDDDFTTAVGGDEVMTNDETDEHATLLEKFRRPPLQMDRQPAMRSPTSVTKHFETHSAKHTAHDWSIDDERRKRDQLKRKGVMFESDSEDADYLSEEYETAIRRERPIDPLHVPPKVSKDLFEVAPELEQDHRMRTSSTTTVSQPRPSRKQQWADLRSRQLQERRERFGNPHWEVSRMRADVIVTAIVQRVDPPKPTDDKFAVGSLVTREEQISFHDFLGAPKLPEICLMNDGDRLGFRDTQKEKERALGRTVRGLCRRTTDDDKWPVRPM